VSGYRARVSEDFIRRGVRIQISRRVEGGYTVYGFEPVCARFVSDTDAGKMDPLDDALFIEDDAARALWEELSRYFGGQPAAITDRADLQAERARVDKLTDAVIRVALRGES
jgi:hypothetical protein